MQEVLSEYDRQRDFLEKSVDTLKHKLHQEVCTHKVERGRDMLVSRTPPLTDVGFSTIGSATPPPTPPPSQKKKIKGSTYCLSCWVSLSAETATL